MSKLRFGWGEVSLVPEGKKINLAGQFYERITDEVRDALKKAISAQFKTQHDEAVEQALIKEAAAVDLSRQTGGDIAFADKYKRAELYGTLKNHFEQTMFYDCWKNCFGYLRCFSCTSDI